VTNTTQSERAQSSHEDTDDLIKRVAELDEELHKKMTREIAVLFTDIRGSTTFFKIHGDIAGRLMMQRHYDMLFPLIEHHEGTIIKTVGDSIMATFNVPPQAVTAAIAMQRRLAEYNVHQSNEDPIRIRIGINYGKGIIEENDVFGNVVNVASKLVALGESEQILVSESVYEELKPAPEFTFFPLKTDQTFYNSLKLKAYAVRWRQEDKIEEKEMTIMSLALIDHSSSLKEKNEGQEEGSDLPNFFAPIEQVVRERAFRTTINPAWRLQAVFEYAETALETALEILRIFQRLHQPFHIGIHTGRTLIEEVEVHGGEEADEAREKAGAHEIYITQPTYEILKDNLLLSFLPLPARLQNGMLLHKLLLESSGKSKTEEPQHSEHKVSHDECFYCSSKNHHTALCPSKRIPFHTTSLNEIGYLPQQEIKSLFAKHVPTIVKPFESDQEDISAPLLPNQSNSFKIPFEAFYEVNEAFQLRFLRRVWSSEASDWNSFNLSTTYRRSGGFVWLGEDSLRVSKQTEALTMFNKALLHNIEDYKPHMGLGFLAIEKGDLFKAAHHFQRALSCTSSLLQRSYLLLLLSRIREVSGNLDDAVDTVREALIAAPHFQDAQYRHAILLAKKGNLRDARSILKTLIETKPDFYLKALIDPGLADLRKEIAGLTTELFDYAHTQASENIKSIKKSLAEHGEWFSKEDYEYQTAEKILAQTIKLFEGNSYFGFLDVISYGLDIKDKLRSALKNRRRSIRKSITSLRSIRDEYEIYLDNYCYKSLINYSDTLLLKNYGDILDKAKSASLVESAESLREAQVFIKELFSHSKKIGNNRKKLDFLKVTVFSSECFFKFLFRFLVCSLSVSAVSCLVLIGYEAYSSSLSAISRNAITDYLKFSLFCGTLFGAGAAVYWIYNNFDHLYSKLKS
jgi:class 3 adenylate cyclase/tetratricopeptide (TPR) repeat protein